MLGTIQKWVQLCLTLIPKIAEPEIVAHWRPITIASVMQKAYLAVVTKLLSLERNTRSDMVIGFAEGHQSVEIYESFRNLVQKGHESGSRMYVLTLDVFRAFDCMKYQAIHDSLLELGAPKKLIHAVLQELSESKVLVSYQGFKLCWPNFKFEKGGTAGGY